MILIILEVIKGIDVMETYKRVMIIISAIIGYTVLGFIVSIAGLFATGIGTIVAIFAIALAYYVFLYLLGFLAFLWLIYFVVLFLSKHPKLIPLYVVCLFVITISLVFLIVYKIIQLT